MKYSSFLKTFLIFLCFFTTHDLLKTLCPKDKKNFFKEEEKPLGLFHGFTDSLNLSLTSLSSSSSKSSIYEDFFVSFSSCVSQEDSDSQEDHDNEAMENTMENPLKENLEQDLEKDMWSIKSTSQRKKHYNHKKIQEFYKKNHGIYIDSNGSCDENFLKDHVWNFHDSQQQKEIEGLFARPIDTFSAQDKENAVIFLLEQKTYGNITFNYNILSSLFQITSEDLNTMILKLFQEHRTTTQYSKKELWEPSMKESLKNFCDEETLEDHGLLFQEEKKIKNLENMITPMNIYASEEEKIKRTIMLLQQNLMNIFIVPIVHLPFSMVRKIAKDFGFPQGDKNRSPMATHYEDCSLTDIHNIINEYKKIKK